MHRLTKAAIATGGAAVLLLGGAGTVAYWTGQATVSGDAIRSGTLTVVAAQDACADWTYATGAAGAGTAVTLIVPGDVVQTTCEITVDGTGDHLAIGAVETGMPQFSDETTDTGDMADQLTVEVSDVKVGGTAITLPTPVTPAGVVLEVQITATFAYGTTALNDTTDALATLSAMPIIVTQANPNAAP